MPSAIQCHYFRRLAPNQQCVRPAAHEGSVPIRPPDPPRHAPSQSHAAAADECGVRAWPGILSPFPWRHAGTASFVCRLQAPQSAVGVYHRCTHSRQKTPRQHVGNDGAASDGGETGRHDGGGAAYRRRRATSHGICGAAAAHQRHSAAVTQSHPRRAPGMVSKHPAPLCHIFTHPCA